MKDESTSGSAKAHGGKSHVRPMSDLNIKTCCVPLSDELPTADFLRFRYEQMLLQLRPSLLEGKWDLLLAAFHPGAPPATCRVSLEGEPVSLVLGRHSASQLRVRSDSALSLRHALVLLSRASDGNISIRVLDLSSSLGVQMEDGTVARSLATNGSLAIRAAETGFFIILRQDLARAEHAQDRTLPGYAALPSSKAHVAELGDEPVEATLKRKSLATPHESHVVAMQGTRFSGAIRYHLYIDNGERPERFDVPASLLRSGCLIGRDSRCHVSSSQFAFGEDVSRLHCLLIEIDGQAMLFDLASMNGTYVEGQQISQMTLAQGHPVHVSLAEEGQRVTVVPAQRERES